MTIMVSMDSALESLTPSVNALLVLGRIFDDVASLLASDIK